ncbi:hypothetical protein A8B75_19055 [Sphingomonadales bacterium EhC05]|nr:hypothetical protein A8B75_19055 [Sphingomonadales bacterium EhC05]
MMREIRPMACIESGDRRASDNAQSVEIILAQRVGDVQRSVVIKGNEASIEQGIDMHCEQESVEGVEPLSVRGASPRLDVGCTQERKVVNVSQRTCPVPSDDEGAPKVALTDPRSLQALLLSERVLGGRHHSHWTAVSLEATCALQQRDRSCQIGIGDAESKSVTADGRAMWCDVFRKFPKMRVHIAPRRLDGVDA